VVVEVKRTASLIAALCAVVEDHHDEAMKKVAVYCTRRYLTSTGGQCSQR
jgi:hypothetical protein